MHYFNRSPSQSIYISLANDVDPATPIGELFKNGPIRVRVMAVRDRQVRIGVQASELLDIHREEVMERGHSAVG